MKTANEFIARQCDSNGEVCALEANSMSNELKDLPTLPKNKHAFFDPEGEEPATLPNWQTPEWLSKWADEIDKKALAAGVQDHIDEPAPIKPEVLWKAHNRCIELEVRACRAEDALAELVAYENDQQPNWEDRIAVAFYKARGILASHADAPATEDQLDEREKFEAHLKTLPHLPSSPNAWPYQRDSIGNYNNNRIDDMWKGWMARSRLQPAVKEFRMLPAREIDAIADRCDGLGDHIYEHELIGRAFEFNGLTIAAQGGV